jgi:hypothetical protein
VEPAAQVALAWLLERPAVTSLVIGARTGEQLADNLAAADLSLSAEERDRLEEVSRRPLLYPYWHQAKTASDRLGPADLLLLGPTWPADRPRRCGGYDPLATRSYTVGRSRRHRLTCWVPSSS